MMPIVRRARADDAEGIHIAQMTSIREICSKDYSKEEIQAWGHRPFRKDLLVEVIQSDSVWVVEKAESIEGVRPS